MGRAFGPEALQRLIRPCFGPEAMQGVMRRAFGPEAMQAVTRPAFGPGTLQWVIDILFVAADGDSNFSGTGLLHFVAAHLVVVEAFQPAAEVFGAEGRGAVGGSAGVLVDGVRDKDGAVGTEGESDGVGGAGVEGDGFAGVIHPDGGVEGVLAKSSDDDAGDERVEAV